MQFLTLLLATVSVAYAFPNPVAAPSPIQSTWADPFWNTNIIPKWCNHGTFGNGDCERTIGQKLRTFCCSFKQEGEFQVRRATTGASPGPDHISSRCNGSGYIMCAPPDYPGT
ncbi:hypothetical protein E4U55_003126 [Claviceps digitariae]|nr:hypothetical protein E4U55_003126 [Claviceps digitariae]